MTCDAHFRTLMSYSSQNSCVKIWFGFVEPFKVYHLNFPGGHKPPIRGVTYDLRCPFSNLAELFQSKVIYVKIWFGLVEPFKSYCVHKQFFFWGGGGGQKKKFI